MEGKLVVVGAGSAGAVIAARASENPRQEVVLLEAGPDYPAPASLPPDLRDGRRNSIDRHDWGYGFEPNAALEPSVFPRGRVTGGSSAVNTCIALRGQPYDYDEWAEIAGPQWRWEACLPAFKRLETDLDHADAWHGQEGPIAIRRHRPDELVPFQAAFLGACERSGHSACADHNRPGTTGFGPHAMNKVEGVRISTAMGYLDRARGRDNLRIVPDAHVARVIIAAGRTRGVEVVRRGERERIAADRVVLSAGAIASPGILFRSGVGPRALLELAGIDRIADLPVGQHLVDHPGTAMVLVPRPGVASGEHPLIQCTMRFGLEDGPPNEMQLQPVSFIDLPGVPLTVAMTLVVGKPSGAGHLYFPDGRPHTKPRIVSRLGEHPRDRRKLHAGLRMAMEVARAPEIAELAQLVWPRDDLLAREDTRWLLPGVGSGYHPCATAPMGPEGDGRSVVDGYGRVYGVEGLLVADASIMPTIPTSNLNLPTIMIGERFGAWLRDGAL